MSLLVNLEQEALRLSILLKKYGGGGHNLACGASLKNWDEVDEILQDLDERAQEYAKNTQ